MTLSVPDKIGPRKVRHRCQILQIDYTDADWTAIIMLYLSLLAAGLSAEVMDGQWLCVFG